MHVQFYQLTYCHLVNDKWHSSFLRLLLIDRYHNNIIRDVGIKESKTNFVFLNPADITLSNMCLSNLVECVSSIKDFAILGPI